jgi:ABC-type polysaccharide/polyol phosphate transport system ATPase subunit
MSDSVIKVENLSKAYQLGQIGTGKIGRDLERFWATRIRGKEDPFLKIGQTNDPKVKGESDVVWSLKDINFEIEKGDAVGIIGRNGAGKSTLLKLLSRVTAPTMGSFKVKGRIASLLEVGTGFHPELTGRENIYLNGAILGMRKKEITRKFDEIVDFSGVERYIDTPVKRYSSGMYVRLAFAVAAHLESEILIVDEVLAVGDAEFQKKCLGKMDDVSKGDGRTILFVSHNMSSIKSLCNKGFLLNNGELVGTMDEIGQTIRQYQYLTDNNHELCHYWNVSKLSKDGHFEIINVKLEPSENVTFSNTDNLKLVLRVNKKNSVKYNHRIVYGIYVDQEFQICENTILLNNLEDGEFVISIDLFNLNLNTGEYMIKMRLDIPKEAILIEEFTAIKFKVDELLICNFDLPTRTEPRGLLHYMFEHNIQKLNQ